MPYLSVLLYTAISSLVILRKPHYIHTNSGYLLGIVTLLSAQGLLPFYGPQLFTANAPGAHTQPTQPVLESTESKTDSGNLRTSTDSVVMNTVTETAITADARTADVRTADARTLDSISVDAVTIAPTESAIDTALTTGSVFYDGDNNSNVVFDESSDVAYVTLIDTATVSLAGGRISHATLSDASAVEMTDSSHISHIDLMGNSTLTMGDEADTAYITLHDFSAVEVSENSQVSHLNLTDRAAGKILGGTFSFINLADESEAHIWRVNIDGGSAIAPGMAVSGGAVTLETGTSLHIYGRSLDFSDGKIVGAWIDETPFEFSLVIANEAGDGSSEVPVSLPDEVTFHEIESYAAADLDTEVNLAAAIDLSTDWATEN